MIKGIIFDFDGVIVESVGVKAEGFKNIYEHYGKEIVSKVLKHHLENGGVSRYDKFRYYHDKFLGLKLSDTDMNLLSNDFSNFVVEQIISAPYVCGALEFLNNNYKKYDFFISTGTPQSEIEEIIKKRKIDYFFKLVFGSPTKKTIHIDNIMNFKNFNNNDLVFIGDSIQDKIASNKMNLSFIARIEGKNTQLLNEKYRINDLTELEKTLERMNKWKD